MKKFTALLFFITAVFWGNAQNKVISFDGSTNSQVTLNTPLGTLSQFTIEFWMKPTSTGNYGATIRPKTNAWTGAPRIQIETNGTFAYGFNSTAGNNAWGKGKFSFDVWNHVAWVFDNGANKLYVNGVHQTDADWTYASGSFDWSDAWLLSGYRAMKGGMDDFRIWKTARTEAEILANYAKQIESPSTTAGLEVYFNFDDGTVTDLAKNTYHGVKGTTTAFIEGAITVPTAVDFGADSDKLNVFPSLVTDSKVFVQNGGSTSGIAKVYSLTGALLVKQLVSIGTSTIDFNGVGSGVYLVSVSVGDESLAKRVVVK